MNKATKTHISKLNIHSGKAEAIDSFFKIQRRGGEGSPAEIGVQIYVPNPTDTTARRTRDIAKRLGGQVIEYRDGKAVKIKPGRAPGVRIKRSGVISRKRGGRRVPGVISR